MANSVTKSDLVSQIAAETGLKKVDAEKALGAITQAIRGALVGGKKVTLVGFGTFVVAEHTARKGRDPRTKRPIDIPSSRKIKFKPGKAMKDAINL
jgi:DNA-binding protein HU-beta